MAEFRLLPFQDRAVTFATNYFIEATEPTRLMISAPTGSGKSFMELAFQDQHSDWLIVTPIIEVIEGLLDKRGLVVPATESALTALAHEQGIWTPKRLNNRLRAGLFDPSTISGLIIDEVHHHTAETYQENDLLMGKKHLLGFTATPFRGTPKSTQKLWEQWPKRIVALDYPTAVTESIIQMPSVSQQLLVDDDEVHISSTGEFEVESVNTHYSSRIADLCDLIKRYYPIDRPTMIAVPSTEIAELIIGLIGEDVPLRFVNAKTSRADRLTAFRECKTCESMLLQIRVVSEGVDLPIRRIIDAFPKLSPVDWLQMFGRAMRPGETRSEYICTNRNFLRHCYLLAGCFPSSEYKKVSDSVPVSRFTGMRAIGLESIGRFKPTRFMTASGIPCEFYAIDTIENGIKREYACLIHPLMSVPIWAAKISSGLKSVTQADGTIIREYDERGKWEWVKNPPTDIRGFRSHSATAVTVPQRAWWVKDAKRVGLDLDQTLDRKVFQVLPFLVHLKLKLK